MTSDIPLSWVAAMAAGVGVGLKLLFDATLRARLAEQKAVLDRNLEDHKAILAERARVTAAEQETALVKLRATLEANGLGALAELRVIHAKHVERLRADLKHEDTQRESRWQIKVAACIEALDIVDGAMANRMWEAENIPSGVLPDWQPLDTRRARSCLNKLTATCETVAVVETFLDCVVGDGSGQGARGDKIADLRKAVRVELGLPLIPLSPARAWIFRLQKLLGQKSPGDA